MNFFSYELRFERSGTAWSPYDVETSLSQGKRFGTLVSAYGPVHDQPRWGQG